MVFITGPSRQLQSKNFLHLELGYEMNYETETKVDSSWLRGFYFALQEQY